MKKPAVFLLQGHPQRMLWAISQGMGWFWASMNIKRISQGRGWSLGVYEYQEDFPREGLIPGRLWISRRFPKGGVDPWASMNIKRISLGRSRSLGVYEYQEDFLREELIPGRLWISKGFPPGGSPQLYLFLFLQSN